MTKQKKAPSPPAQGMRLSWEAIPAQIRSAIEDRFGSPVVSVESQPKGFSPGIAARLITADRQRAFVKAAGPAPNPDVASFHRREARIASLLPPSAPAPRLLWSLDDQADTGWVVLAFEDVNGRHPAQPWLPHELTRVLEAMVALSDSLTPSPLPAESTRTASELFAVTLCGWRRLQQSESSTLDRLDAWSSRHLADLATLEAAAGDVVTGDTLLHMDIREDNLLLTPDAVWFVDWPHASIGAAWVDVVCFAPSVTMCRASRRQNASSPITRLPGKPIRALSRPRLSRWQASSPTARCSPRRRACLRCASFKPRRGRWRGSGSPNALGGIDALRLRPVGTLEPLGDRRTPAREA